jgi:hypothetical protein
MAEPRDLSWFENPKVVKRRREQSKWDQEWDRGDGGGDTRRRDSGDYNPNFPTSAPPQQQPQQMGPGGPMNQEILVCPITNTVHLPRLTLTRRTTHARHTHDTHDTHDPRYIGTSNHEYVVIDRNGRAATDGRAGTQDGWYGHGPTTRRTLRAAHGRSPVDRRPPARRLRQRARRFVVRDRFVLYNAHMRTHLRSGGGASLFFEKRPRHGHRLTPRTRSLRPTLRASVQSTSPES